MNTPTDAFVPLAAHSAAQGNRQEFRVLLAARPENARPLREVNPAAVAPAGEAVRTPCEPRAVLQREGSTITGIQIHCTCGQVLSLKCEYPAP
ncbi:MAG TPA: hypothetical protein VKY92_01490 [Verrucomicrobiae bacterium]|nr:hypothetical protein [Verrucomicrobiae bacterium]